jgi:hypothetical protein
MSTLATLLVGNAFRVKLSEQNSDADIILIDVTMSETTNLEAEITEHPVEDGPDVTDHVRPKPISIDIEGIISETPLTLGQDVSKLTTSTKAAATSIARGFAGGVAVQYASKLGSKFGSISGAAAGFGAAALFQSSASPSKAAYDILTNMLLGKKLFKLATKYKVYDNMVITSLKFPRTNDTGRALRFTMSCKQINLIQGQTVGAIARTASGGIKKKDLGKQPPKEAAKPVYKSLAKRGLTSLIGLFKGGGDAPAEGGQ